MAEREQQQYTASTSGEGAPSEPPDSQGLEKQEYSPARTSSHTSTPLRGAMMQTAALNPNFTGVPTLDHSITYWINPIQDPAIQNTYRDHASPSTPLIATGLIGPVKSEQIIYINLEASGDYVCRPCGVNLNSDERVREHVRSHHAKYEWPCSHCDLLLYNVEKFKKHQDHCPYKGLNLNLVCTVKGCKSEGHRFSEPKNFKAHMENKHKNYSVVDP